MVFRAIRKHRRKIVTGGILFIAAMMVLSAIPTYFMGAGSKNVVAIKGYVQGTVYKGYSLQAVRVLCIPKSGVSTNEVKKAVSNVPGVENANVAKVKYQGTTLYVVDALVATTANLNKVKDDVTKAISKYVLASRAFEVKGSVFVFQAAFRGKPDTSKIESNLKKYLKTEIIGKPKIETKYNAVIGEVICNVASKGHVAIKDAILKALKNSGATGALVYEKVLVKVQSGTLELLGPGETKIGTKKVNFGGRLQPALLAPEHVGNGKKVKLYLWIAFMQNGKQRAYLVDPVLLGPAYRFFA